MRSLLSALTQKNLVVFDFTSQAPYSEDWHLNIGSFKEALKKRLFGDKIVDGF